jgi:ABC-type branched-subunit amino acid transport system ATPase component
MLRRAPTSAAFGMSGSNQALKLSEYCYILESGQIALEGRSNVLSADPAVQHSYLGTI